MKEPVKPSEPITCDFSPWSMLDPGEQPTTRAALVIAAIILAGFGAFLGLVHFWR